MATVKKPAFDFKTLQKYVNPQAMKDFDRFLDAMPLNVGYNALIAAGISWILAGAAVLFASMEASKVTTLRADLMEIESLKPPIPELEYIPVSKSSLENLAKKMEKLYPGISILVGGEGKVTVSGSAVSYYPQFRSAISHFQSGGKSWHVNVKSLCVGRECKGPSLQADLQVEAAHVAEAKPMEKKTAADKK